MNNLPFDVTDKKYSYAFGSGTQLVDIENHTFTEYVESHRDDLVHYARTINNMDYAKASDLIHDVWISYLTNETNNECYDSTMGHGNDISVAEAVHSRIKRMSLKKDKSSDNLDYAYLKNMGGSNVVCSNFSDKENEDDPLQKKLTIKFNEAASDSEDSIKGVLDNYDLLENMIFFCKQTISCRFTGVKFLQNIDTILSYVSEGKFNKDSAYLFIEYLHMGNDLLEALKVILDAHSKNPELFKGCLKLVEKEINAEKEVLGLN